VAEEHEAAEASETRGDSMQGIADKQLRDTRKDMRRTGREMQRGPEYENRKAQKASSKVAKANKPKKAKSDDKPLVVQAGNAIWGAGEDVADSVTDSMEDAQRGPNYHSASTDKKANIDKKPSKIEKANAGEEKAEEEDTKPPASGCKNSPKGWEDSKGRDCEDYAEGEWCTRHGGYGDAWLDEWGTFEDFANKGTSAKEACCVCGGGLRKDSDKGGEPPVAKPGSAPSPAQPSAPAGPAADAPVPALTGPILDGKGNKPLQEQGYSGELVIHEDGDTMTSDWGREFGPKAGHRDIKSICLQHPGNEWCDLHGYYDKPRSDASTKSFLAAIVALIFAFMH